MVLEIWIRSDGPRLDSRLPHRCVSDSLVDPDLETGQSTPDKQISTWDGMYGTAAVARQEERPTVGGEMEWSNVWKDDG